MLNLRLSSLSRFYKPKRIINAGCEMLTRGGARGYDEKIKRLLN